LVTTECKALRVDMARHRHQIADRRHRAQLQADRDITERQVEVDQEGLCACGRNVGTKVRGDRRLATPSLGVEDDK